MLRLLQLLHGNTHSLRPSPCCCVLRCHLTQS
jgi:hypothetical protein